MSALTPSVSIITITYNHERYIGACIESVLAQTWTDWEQIILDDGSTDGTEDVVRSFRDDRIRFVRQQHRGIDELAATYNRALALCSGSLIAILEGDDAWPAGKLQRQIPALENPEVIFSYGEACNIDAEGVPARRISRNARQRQKLPRAILNNDPIGSTTPYLLSVEGQSLVETSSVLIRREALNRIGGFQHFPGGCPTDVPTFTKLSTVGMFRYSPVLLGYHRRHPNSATQQFLDPMWRSSREFVLNCLNQSEYPLSAAERGKIERSWDPRSASREFAAGRLCSVQRRWVEARSHFLRALDFREPRATLAASVGWLLAWLHADLEGLFRVAGRTPMKAADVVNGLSISALPASTESKTHELPVAKKA